MHSLLIGVMAATTHRQRGHLRWLLMAMMRTPMRLGGWRENGDGCQADTTERGPVMIQRGCV
ncbi:hypothetical protein ADM96_18200 [Burkholderia sp. ST111]|jgi:hypothetical protein|nr:hypothetical protein ADM96_18200 [Burkholderia sp. ST111]